MNREELFADLRQAYYDTAAQMQKKLLITLKTPWQYGCYITTSRGLKFVLSGS